MKKRRLNPRAAAVYKALYKKPHPDAEKPEVKIPSAQFYLLVRDLARSFVGRLAVEVIESELKKVVEHIKLEERERLTEELVRRYLALDPADLAGPERRRGDYSLIYEVDRGTPIGRYQSVITHNRPNPYDDRPAEHSGEVYVFAASMYTLPREPVRLDGSEFRIPTSQPEIAQVQPVSPRRNRPPNPDANIRGFRQSSRRLPR